jgi:hypothetical protein
MTERDNFILASQAQDRDPHSASAGDAGDDEVSATALAVQHTAEACSEGADSGASVDNKSGESEDEIDFD